MPGRVLITCNLGAGPGASLVAGGDGGLVVGVCGLGGLVVLVMVVRFVGVNRVLG